MPFFCFPVRNFTEVRRSAAEFWSFCVRVLGDRQTNRQRWTSPLRNAPDFTSGGLNKLDWTGLDIIYCGVLCGHASGRLRRRIAICVWRTSDAGYKIRMLMLFPRSAKRQGSRREKSYHRPRHFHGSRRILNGGHFTATPATVLKYMAA